jgi:hypothetical protein
VRNGVEPMAVAASVAMLLRRFMGSKPAVAEGKGCLGVCEEEVR